MNSNSVCLFDKNQIEGILNRIASRINGSKISEVIPIITTVMKGSMIFSGNLIPKLNFKCELDYLHATRYGAEKVGKEVRWLSEPLLNPKDRDVIILDDILDEGITLDHISKYYEARGARSITIVVLLWKPTKSNYQPTYFGEAIEDFFVYGYGMNTNDGFNRNLAEIRYKIDIKE